MPAENHVAAVRRRQRPPDDRHGVACFVERRTPIVRHAAVDDEADCSVRQALSHADAVERRAGGCDQRTAGFHIQFRAFQAAFADALLERAENCFSPGLGRRRFTADVADRETSADVDDVKGCAGVIASSASKIDERVDRRHVRAEIVDLRSDMAVDAGKAQGLLGEDGADPRCRSGNLRCATELRSRCARLHELVRVGRNRRIDAQQHVAGPTTAAGNARELFDFTRMIHDDVTHADIDCGFQLVSRFEAAVQNALARRDSASQCGVQLAERTDFDGQSLVVGDTRDGAEEQRLAGIGDRRFPAGTRKRSTEQLHA